MAANAMRWVFNSSPAGGKFDAYTVNEPFTSNDKHFVKISSYINEMTYYTSDSNAVSVYDSKWADDSYKIIIFDSPPSDSTVATLTKMRAEPELHVNCVTVDGTSILDLSGDTVSAGKMLSGTTAHDRAGAPISGKIKTYGSNIFDYQVNVTGSTSIKTAGMYLTRNLTITVSSSGKKNVATGTVTPTRNKLQGRPVTVSGLSFAPQTVILYLTSASTGPDAAYTYVVFSVSGEWTALAQDERTLAYIYENTSNSAVHITLNSDGFSLETSDTTYGVLTKSYSYIAIGE